MDVILQKDEEVEEKSKNQRWVLSTSDAKVRRKMGSNVSSPL